LVGECGTDLKPWPRAKHSTSWLCLAPGNKISGGKVLSSRAGKAKEVTATARKIAVLFYNTLRYSMAYKDPGASHYEDRYRSRVLGTLHRRAKAFGLVLTEVPDQGELADCFAITCRATDAPDRHIRCQNP